VTDTAATFVFADIAGFTALTEAHGDEAAMELVAAFSSAVESRLPRVAGEHVKTIGLVFALAGALAFALRDTFVRGNAESIPLPSNDADIAYAPVSRLSRWIEQKALTSERLTNIYLKRIEQFDSKLRCIITLTRDVALEQAKRADAEIATSRRASTRGCRRASPACRPACRPPSTRRR